MIKKFLLLSVLAAVTAGGVFALTDFETTPQFEWQIPSMNLVSSQNSAINSPAGGDDQWVFYKFSVGRRLSAGFLNLFFGLGSFTMGDSDGGLGIMGRELAGVGLTGLGAVLIFGSMNMFNDMGAAALLIIPFVIPIAGIAAGIVIGITGITYFTSGVITGFRRPFIFKRPIKTARLNDINNWSVGLVPDINGEPAGQVAFTMHF